MELAQIRHIFDSSWVERRKPGHDELWAIWRASGRTRPFRAWECDAITDGADAEQAYAQETRDEDSPDAWSPYVKTWAELHPPKGEP